MLQRVLSFCSVSLPLGRLGLGLGFGCALFIANAESVASANGATSAQAQSDAEMREAMIGTWTMGFSKKTPRVENAYVTYRRGGTFMLTVIGRAPQSLARIESEGRWELNNRTLRETITKTPVQSLVGSGSVSQVISVDRGKLVTREQSGIQVLRRANLPKALPPILDNLPTADVAKLAIASPQPIYPYEARARSYEGKGLFKLKLTPAGTVESIQTVKNTGYPILDAAAKAALAQWRFKTLGLKEVVIPIDFEMGH